MNNPKRIYVHCAATPEGVYFDRDDIDRWHKDRGWSGIGYHKVILLDGTVQNGRDPDGDGDVEEHIGAHVYGHNKDSLAVCYIGGIDHTTASKPKDTRTPAQAQALLETVSNWMDEFNIPLSHILGHYETDPGKACPSFDMGEFRLALQTFRRDPLSQTKKPVSLSVINIDGCTKYTLQINALSTYDNICVKMLQQALNKWLNVPIRPPLIADGFFGRLTKNRVRLFQEENQLTVDGIVGPVTWKALDRYL